MYICSPHCRLKEKPSTPAPTSPKPCSTDEFTCDNGKCVSSFKVDDDDDDDVDEDVFHIQGFAITSIVKSGDVDQPKTRCATSTMTAVITQMSQHVQVKTTLR